MWRQLGIATITATSDRVQLGRYNGPLQNGYLPLRFRSRTGGAIVPLSFGIVIPVAYQDTAGLPEARYYPQQDDTLVQVGPGIGDSWDGMVWFKPRSYNSRFLKAGYPGRYWVVSCEAWAPIGSTDPIADVPSFTDGSRDLKPGPDRIGPAGAAPLQ